MLSLGSLSAWKQKALLGWPIHVFNGNLLLAASAVFMLFGLLNRDTIGHQPLHPGQMFLTNVHVPRTFLCSLAVPSDTYLRKLAFEADIFSFQGHGFSSTKAEEAGEGQDDLQTGTTSLSNKFEPLSPQTDREGGRLP